MRSFWITQLGPKSDEKCLNKRKTEGDLRQTHREGEVKINTESGMILS